jgi:uncharacterized protein (TIGR02611 family)
VKNRPKFGEELIFLKRRFYIESSFIKGMIASTLKSAKRMIKIVFGFTVVALGIAMLVLPGPGWLTIFFGLVILATEYVWAKNLLDKAKSQVDKIRNYKKKN